MKTAILMDYHRSNQLTVHHALHGHELTKMKIYLDKRVAQGKCWYIIVETEEAYRLLNQLTTECEEILDVDDWGKYKGDYTKEYEFVPVAKEGKDGTR